MTARFLSAILIYSEKPALLASFYKDLLGIPLEDEQHGNTDLHYGCEMGDIHFAIHGSKDGKPGVGSVKINFEVFDIEAQMEVLRKNGVTVISEPQDMGFMKLAQIQDPDGNTVGLTQMSKRWFDFLKKDRAEGNDIIAQYDKLNPN
jgi:predicted enzyme related to lactoylglutathione lyase